MSYIAMVDSDAFCIKGIEEYCRLRNVHTVGCSSLSQLEETLKQGRINVVISELVTDEDNLFSCIDYYKNFTRRWPAMRLVIFTHLRDPALIAYVRKTLPHCKVIFKHESVFSFSHCMMQLGGGAAPGKKEISGWQRDILTPQEFYLLRFLSEGKRHKDISRRMPLSAKTISYYKLKIMEKLKCKTMADFQRRMHDFGVYYSSRV